MSKADFITGYIECALWAECANTEENAGRQIGSVADLSPEADAIMSAEAGSFYETHQDLISQANEELWDSHLGHDLWLSRNGHGSGFWDRELGELGDALHKAAKAQGERALYIGDDGMIYQS